MRENLRNTATTPEENKNVEQTLTYSKDCLQWGTSSPVTTLCSGSAEFFVAQKGLEVLVTLVTRTIVTANIKAEVACRFMRHPSRRPHTCGRNMAAEVMRRLS